MAKVSPEAAAFHERVVVADMHAHPSLKTFLVGEKFHLPHRPGRGMGVFTLQTSLPSLQDGAFDIQVNTVYVPERGLAEDCFIVDGLSRAISRVRRGFKDPFAVTLETLDHFEEAVAHAAREPKGRVPVVARSVAELEAALRDDRIAVLHAVEGGHSLGGELDNLDVLFDRGVCMLTLAHFYENGVAPPVEAIPHDFFLRKVGCFKRPKDLSLGLTEFGRQVMERMIERGMLIDLTHCTPRAREEAFDINGGRSPLLFSHVGLHELAPYDINPTAEEIKRVADTGGMVGVILMPYFLTTPKNQKGYEPVIETLRRMIDAGGTDAVGIGSDYDGFTDPPDDLREPADFPRFTERLLEVFGSDTAEKILGANFLRVLKTGWRKS